MSNNADKAKNRRCVVFVLVAIVLAWFYNSYDLGRLWATPTPMPPPEPTDTCNSDTLDKALTDLKVSYEDFNDAVKLLSDAFKAANGSANSSAVITALAGVTNAKRAAERIAVPDCISQAHYILIGYVNTVESDLRLCVVDGDCFYVENNTWDDYTYDFNEWYKYGNCLKSHSEGYCFQNNFPVTAYSYNPDGSIVFSPEVKASAEAFINAEKTKIALTQKP